MQKVYKSIKALWQLLKHPYLLQLMFDEKHYWRKQVIKKYGFEQGLPVVQLSDFFLDSTETIVPFAFLGGGSWPTDLALLQLLVKKFHADNYLEIGTWRGESAANIAPMVKSVTTINMPDATILKQPNGTMFVDALRQFSEGIGNVEHIQADSLTLDFASLNKKFDLIFVDGDHSYDAVKSDTQKVLRVLADGGIIVWHDYTRNFDEIRWSVLQGILDGLPQAMHSNLYHVSNTLCAIYLPNSNQIFKTTALNPYEKAKKHFEVTIQVK